MTQTYFEPDREADPYALPDLEIFYLVHGELSEPWADDGGWFWWACLPGCLPDSDPSGPFQTEREALDDARGGA
jgi:hypothetical protein